MLFYVIYVTFPCYSKREPLERFAEGTWSESIMTTLEWPWLRPDSGNASRGGIFRLREEGWLRWQGSHMGQVGHSRKKNSQCQVIFRNLSLCIFIIFQCQDLEKLKLWLWDSVQTLYSLSGSMDIFICALIQQTCWGQTTQQAQCQEPWETKWWAWLGSCPPQNTANSRCTGAKHLKACRLNNAGTDFQLYCIITVFMHLWKKMTKRVAHGEEIQ